MSIAIPVSLLTGFLGAGKTTLLNCLLKSGELADTALIINEFGDVGIDHLLVETADEGIVELSDGCLCCTIRGDLVDTLNRLVARNPRPARIIIETTGLADPAPILHAVMAHPFLSETLRLDGVITVVDAVNGMATLDGHEEAVKQVAVADRIVVTKGDLAEETTALKTRLKSLNPMAQVLQSSDELTPSALLECGLYDPKTKTADVSRWLADEALNDGHRDHGHDDHDHRHNHGHHHHHGHSHHHDVNRHDARIRAFTLKTKTPIPATTLATFVDLLRSAHGPKLLRMKGIVRIVEDEERPVVLHGVQEVFHPPATLPAWPAGPRETRMVMITRDMAEDYVQRLFKALVGDVAVDTPDKTALEQNPLAVPGKTF
ncbi:MAG: GTP-binding protein [Pseudomonadota bacterium]